MSNSIVQMSPSHPVPAQAGTGALLTRLARPEVRDLPAYNAGLSSELVRPSKGAVHAAAVLSFWATGAGECSDGG